MHPSDESQWVIRIRNILEEEWEEVDDDIVSASITGVPKPLLSAKPEAYVPQLIALGPYNHDREELREMERYKLSVAKRIRTRLPNVKFGNLVDLFIKLEYRIRVHYQRYLPLSSETLAWMMAIDASFLLECLQVYADTAPDALLRIPSRVARAASSGQRTSTHDMLLRDIVKLENQIPLFLLYKILELQFSSPDVTEEYLTPMLVGILKELTPFKMISVVGIKENSHLLELLYHSIVPYEVEESADGTEERADECCSRTERIAAAAKAVVVARGKALLLVLVKILVTIPWRAITSIPAFAAFKQPIESILQSRDESAAQVNRGGQDLQFEEITIPSVTELAYAGVRFEASDGDVTSVAFDVRTATLRLPRISLDVNSEVVVRNLVAYETAVKPGPLTFTRYVELMNGIIDSGEDARALREGGVVVNGLRSDVEVADLWNGMSRSVRLTRVRFLDDVIEGVNAYYEGRWKVKARRFARRYVAGSWESALVVVITLFMVMMGFQVFSAGMGIWGWASLRKRTL